MSTSNNTMEIIPGKTLKLNHVLSRKVKPEELSDFQKIGVMFQAFTKANRLTLYGPSITRTSVELKDGTPEQTIEILGQIREVPETVPQPYTFTEQLRVENCLFIRYRGPMNKLQFAYQKLSLYCFENDITPKSETYTIYLEAKGALITADIFVEVAL